MTRASPQARVARSIHDATVLDSLGWRMSISFLRAARAAAVLLSLCASGIISAIAFDWLSAAMPLGGADVAALGASAISFYLLVMHVARELLTVRRVHLTDHPLADFFRAMDIPRRLVVVTECRDRLVAMGAVVGGICWGAAARSATTGMPFSATVTLLLLPVAVVVGALATTVSIAARPRMRRRPRVLLSLVAGVGAGSALAVIIRLGSFAVDGGSGEVVSGIWIGSAASVLLTMTVFATISVAGFRSLERADFDARPLETSADVRPRLRSRREIVRWGRIVLSDLSPVPRIAAISRLVFLTWACGAAVVGTQVMTLEPAGWRAPESAVDRLVCVITFFLGITVAEMLSRWVGPTALAGRWRASWEAGGRASRLAAAPILVAVALGSLAATPISVATASVGGDGAIPFAVTWSAIACAWIAVGIVTGDPPRADGTAALPMSAGIICVIASAAMTAAALAASVAGIGWIGLTVSVLLLGGAVWVARLRVLSLPSRPLA